MLKREKTKQQKPQKFQQNSVLLDYNPAYNDRNPSNLNLDLAIDSHHHNYEQQTEPYYSLVTQAEDDAVSGTRDSYVEMQPSYYNSDNTYTK